MELLALLRVMTVYEGDDGVRLYYWAVRSFDDVRVSHW